MTQNREELLKHLAASLKDAKEQGGAILLVGAGISVSAGIPPAQQLMKIAIENFPDYFTEEEQCLAQEDINQLQYNDIMTKLSNVKRKELFKWFIEGNKTKGIKKAKLNFAHIAIAELLKQGYFSRILTVNFDPLLIHACYMVGMYPFPAIYDLGAMGQVNAELLHDPSIVYLNGQHVGFVQRNTTDQLEAHKETLTQIVRSTGCSKTWVVAGYSGENDPLMDALNELRPYNNWLYWLEYNEQVLQKSSHQFLESDEECKVIYKADADNIFMQIADLLNCNLDFIESPNVELALYEREINFQTAGTKQNYFTKKIKHYRQLLSQPELIKLLEEVEDFNTSLILQGITQKIIHLCQSSDEEQMLELVKIGDIFKKQINLDDNQFQNFQKIPMLFANIFILAYEKNITIDPKPLTDNGLLEFAWMFCEVAENIQPNCAIEIRNRINDLKKCINI
ncbi:hypothetical protein [Acinetobacter sp. ANC 4216]|uniref:hypothetical protein n=1 Tax=Acinetobacter sp. ANC 4216 TaxID=2529840 RepID=UPI00207710AD|nr:hypothetical protein [Acinetobacter sp. ANC 4216]